ncbi:aquaporin [Aquisphaera insulae]|uniref:aquaporin n=1 Tax=Aquisphaera insulae TaxID=2712864 RepID=UPI0013E9D4D0|nr:aquaporin [Aquisphaera insulae]
MRRKAIAELAATFILVFAGTGAIVVNQEHGGAVTHVGISLTFGLVVLAMIYAVGDVSGAHLNPAVSIAFNVAGKMPLGALGVYVACQTAGALLASLALRVLFPANDTLGATLPAGSVWQSFAFEVVLTFILMFVVLRVSTGAKEKGITAGIAVGAVIALEALFAGPVCGASMNPVRSLAPALVGGHLEHLWAYLTAPTLGALVAVGFDRLIEEPEQPADVSPGISA